MKFAIIALCIFSSTMVSADTGLVEKLVGQYATIDGNCAYDTATIKAKRMNGVNTLLIDLNNSRTKAFNVHSMDMDNMWSRVRTTRGFQRIIKQDRIQGQTILAEEKNCSLGWISCDEWTTKAEVTLLDADTIEAKLSEAESACTFRRITK